MTEIKTFNINIKTPEGVILVLPFDSQTGRAITDACDLLTKRADELNLDSTVEVTDPDGVRIGASADANVTIAEMIENAKNT